MGAHISLAGASGSKATVPFITAITVTYRVGFLVLAATQVGREVGLKIGSGVVFEVGKRVPVGWDVGLLGRLEGCEVGERGSRFLVGGERVGLAVGLAVDKKEGLLVGCELGLVGWLEGW